MGISKLLIANRGEIAIRIARAAAELGIASVAVHSADDAASRHVLAADEVWPLPGVGSAAYLDIAAIVAAAQAAGCDALHPGYGFLSENPELALACAEQGLTFVGPSAELLRLLGDKTRARALARECGVPVLPGSDGAVELAEAEAFFDALGPDGRMVVKAVAGGGGRGMRVIERREALPEAYARARAEAEAAFGNGALYVERLIPRARHVEIQVVGDGDAVVHLWERECTLQRRHQKLIEIAPSPTLGDALRDRLAAAAVRLARAAGYRSLGTFEFLVDDESGEFFFIEANPRLQVEHTVTEQVTGIDLVQTQLRIAGGARLADLGLSQDAVPRPDGHAIQLRINMETMDADGAARSAAGTLAVYEPPTGPGIRVDGYGYAGYTASPRFDSLLAKLVVHGRGDFAAVARRAYRALAEFRIEGVATNLGFLQSLLDHPDVQANRVYTRFVDDHAAALVAAAARQRRLFAAVPAPAAAATTTVVQGPDGTLPVAAPMAGVLAELSVAEGDAVRAGQQVAVLEAMKMQHVVSAPVSGRVRLLAAEVGASVGEGQPLVFVEEGEVDAAAAQAEEAVDLDAIRPDLAEAIARHEAGLDAARPEAVARRRKTGQRTARENIADLVDPGSFIEYGALALAAQRQRRSVEDLIKLSPADGLIGGVGSVNGDRYAEDRARCMVMSYDYTVFAGTQGAMNHYKTDRLLKLAEQWRLPIVIFAEGGGGRPGDTDVSKVAGLDVPTFRQYAALSGLMPRIAIVSGRCFAGNAALAGCSDVLIATENTTIGMGGPAMIEGGGLGVYKPEEVGPVSMQAPNGVLDCVVADEAAAVAAAKQLLSYFQGPVAGWDCADQRLLRRAIPENRLRAYDIRALIRTLADTGSVLELREQFAPGMITAFVRIEGRPMGLIANNPAVLAGAITADGADKAARFMQLCDAFDIPILCLCDTPGIMVGPDAERTALVRHASRMFITAASVTVPFFTLVLRKGYGLGAQTMAGGSFHAPFFTAAWPTGEFGAMGLEGAVRLGFRKELEAIEDPAQREAAFKFMVAGMYERGKAVNMASFLEIDAVIDPMESRRWIVRGLKSVPAPLPRSGKKRPFVDAW